MFCFLSESLNFKKMYHRSRFPLLFLKRIQEFTGRPLSCRCGSTLSALPKRRFKLLDGELTVPPPQLQQLKESAAVNEREHVAKIQRIKDGASTSAVHRHTVMNKKILARERINLLVDDDYPVLELGVFAGLGMDYGDIPGAGSICAIAKISGQLCMITANEATIKGGTIYPIGLKKTLRCHEIAMQNRLPCFHYVDSGGAFLPLQAEIFIEGGRAFYNEAIMNSEGIPQICIVAGSCTAGGAYIPTMANQVVMVDKIASIFLAGPPLVYAAIGQRISEQNLGGATVHCGVSGVADYKAVDELDSIETAKDIMSTLNMEVYFEEATHVEEPMFNVQELALLSVHRDQLGRLDVPKILARIVDGSRFHAFKPSWGCELITGFARINGVLVGIVANHGPFTSDACQKGANFVTLCHQRGTPIVFLQHITGNVSDPMLIKPISQLMSAVAVATVPKITIIMGESYGVGNYAMCGRSMSPRFLFTWPTARVAIDKYELYGDVTGESGCYYASSRVWDDGVLLPQDTRDVLKMSLSACLTHQPVERLNTESVNYIRL